MQHVSQHPLHAAFVLPAAWISIKPVLMSQHSPSTERSATDSHHGVLRRLLRPKLSLHACLLKLRPQLPPQTPAMSGQASLTFISPLQQLPWQLHKLLQTDWLLQLLLLRLTQQHKHHHCQCHLNSKTGMSSPHQDLLQHLRARLPWQLLRQLLTGLRPSILWQVYLDLQQRQQHHTRAILGHPVQAALLYQQLLLQQQLKQLQTGWHHRLDH